MNNHWIFSNHQAGYYKESIWDTSQILRTKRWYFGEENPNATAVRKGDWTVARIYGGNYFARFQCGTSFTIDPRHSGRSKRIGFIAMDQFEKFDPAIPQWLVIDELSNKNVRNKIIKITSEDSRKIEWAVALYRKMGGSLAVSKNIVLLERGLEEALKHNLHSLGLELADKKIAQQCRMGVGRSDLICKDRKGNLCVIELKRAEQHSTDVVGQVLKYVGWLREHVAKPGQKVRGMVVCGGASQELIYSCQGADLELRTFRIP